MSTKRIVAFLGRSLDGSSQTLYRRRFVRRASGSAFDTKSLRYSLARQYRRIHKRVPCAHQEAEALILAEAILSLSVPGPVVELGCYKGGLTSKLSLACQAAGRQLYVCDSFQGLPQPREADSVHARVSGRLDRYRQGDYGGTFEEVSANVTRFGAVAVCQFVKGYYCDTLPRLEISPALVFMDVDLIESARDCVRHFWRRIIAGGQFFTHEAGGLTFVRGLLNPHWWHREFGECPPVLFGAGYGYGPLAQNLAYLDTTRDTAPPSI